MSTPAPQKKKEIQKKSFIALARLATVPVQGDHPEKLRHRLGACRLVQFLSLANRKGYDPLP